jgi:DNA-dependent RNA polymerase auxiliary subunit epsilon
MGNRFIMIKWPIEHTQKLHHNLKISVTAKAYLSATFDPTFHISFIYWVSGQNWFYEFEKAL